MILQVGINNIIEAMEDVSFQKHVSVPFTVACTSWDAHFNAFIANKHKVTFGR